VITKKHRNWDVRWHTERSDGPRGKYKDSLTTEQIDHFREFCPSCEGGFHTINSVSISLWIEEDILFERYVTEILD
jgi:hypothetical protein